MPSKSSMPAPSKEDPATTSRVGVTFEIFGMLNGRLVPLWQDLVFQNHHYHVKAKGRVYVTDDPAEGFGYAGEPGSWQRLYGRKSPAAFGLDPDAGIVAFDGQGAYAVPGWLLEDLFGADWRKTVYVARRAGSLPRSSQPSEPALQPERFIPKESASAATESSTRDLADAIVAKLKERLRAAVLKLMPQYFQALVADAQPTPEEERRLEEYKKSAGALRIAEAIETAATAVIAAINPLAGALVGAGVAALSTTQEQLAKDIDSYVPPWLKKDAGLTMGIAVGIFQKRVYSYRGFTSMRYGDAPNNIFGVRADQQSAFDDHVDSLLAKGEQTLGIPDLHRYFPAMQLTERLDWEDRDNEKILPDPSKRIVAQYLPAELETVLADAVLAQEPTVE